MKKENVIKIIKNGPYIVDGTISLFKGKISIIANNVLGVKREHDYNTSEEMKDDSYSLCRCGESSNAPFCDGTHVQIGFDGEETASNNAYLDRAEAIRGENLIMLDDNRCAYARFCHREQGDVWTLARYSGDPENKREAIEGACECPTGRLTAMNLDGDIFEKQYKPEIGVIQDPGEDVSAGLFVRGDIQLIGADGSKYEKQNRMALCRCGQSRNKPFCDAAHVSIRYSDH